MPYRQTRLKTGLAVPCWVDFQAIGMGKIVFLPVENRPDPLDLGFFGQPPRARFLEKNWLTPSCEIFREKSANPQT